MEGEVEVEAEGGEEIKEEKDDADDEAEIAKLIKDEDINMIVEDTDVTEIDKLTGQPRPKGKSFTSLQHN
jgi:hypothetical protein